MKSIVLAAGYATRLYPLTENFPKPLLKVGEKSILDRLLEDLDKTDITEFVVVSNHKFIEHFKQWKQNLPYATEVTIFADKICVDEETVRLKSHVSSMRKCLNLMTLNL